MQPKITFRVPDDLAQGFEAFIKDHSQTNGTRQDAMRFILRDWLFAKGYVGSGDKRGTE